MLNFNIVCISFNFCLFVQWIEKDSNGDIFTQIVVSVLNLQLFILVILFIFIHENNFVCVALTDLQGARGGLEETFPTFSLHMLQDVHLG